MNKISSLPNMANHPAGTKGLWSYEYENGKSQHPDIVLSILEHNIPLWKQECSPDITHFSRVLNIEPNHDYLIIRVLYECMEKNELNIEFISSRNAQIQLKPISKDLYPNMYALVSNTNLDYIKQTKNTIACLNLLEKNNILNLRILSEIFNPLAIKSTNYRALDLNNQTEIDIISYVLKDPDLYKFLLPNIESDSDTSSSSILDAADVYYYKRKVIDYLATSRFYTSDNLDKILNNLDIIFKTRNDMLIGLTGLSILTSQYSILFNNPEHINTVYKEKFKSEYNLLSTITSLGITDFDTIMTHISGLHQLQNIEAVELPFL